MQKVLGGPVVMAAVGHVDRMRAEKPEWCGRIHAVPTASTPDDSDGCTNAYGNYQRC